MLAAVIIIVAVLFFLGLGLLISTNVAVVLIFAGIGLLLGGLVGVLLLRGGPVGNQHWAIFAGPLISGLFFVMLCGILNLLVRDAVGASLGGLRMFSVALLLGTGPGLIVGWLLGVNVGGRAIRPGYAARGQAAPGASAPQGQHGGYNVPRGQPGQPAAWRPAGAPVGPPPAPPIGPPGPPPTQPAGNEPAWTPIGGSTGGLLERVSGEQASLARYGVVQILDPRDGTACVVVTRPHDRTSIYMVCSPAYPQQPPAVSVERGGVPLNVGGGVLFPWNGAHHRLADIVQDLMGRV